MHISRDKRPTKRHKRPQAQKPQPWSSLGTMFARAVLISLILGPASATNCTTYPCICDDNLEQATIAPTAWRTTARSARPTARRRPRELAGITYATATGMWEKHGPARLGAGAKASPVTLCTTIQATVAAVTKATNLVATTPETPVTWILSASVGRRFLPWARITRF